jgi:hypothetical protein
VKARLDALLAQRQPVPSPKAHITLADPLDFALVRYENRLLDATPADKVTAYRGAAEFPGVPAPGAVPISKTLTLDMGVTGRHSLGLYAAPGARITVTIAGDPEQIKARGLKVQIGAHSDSLYTAPGGKTMAQRLPNVVRAFPIEGNSTLAANAVGGLVYIVSPPGTIPGKLPLDHNDHPKSDFVTVKVDGAIASPLYELGKTTTEDWKQQLATTRAPWAEIGSQYIILTMPLADAQAVADPAFLMTEWDRIARASYQFIGYPEDHVPIRPERFVGDVQISAGGAHAGYPIMTPVSWARRYSNPEALKSGNNWGLYHELGHNFQDPDWSFANNGEVSNNMFVFLARGQVFGMPMWEDKPLNESRAALKDKLAKGVNPWETGDNFSRLLFWYDIVHDLGFEPVQKAFWETQRNTPPADETQRRVLLLTRLSRAAGKNLGPYFEKWGILTPADIPAEVSKLPVWLPADMA